MLSSCRMIGFLITTDPKRARKFYEEILGFTFVSEDQFALAMKTDENMIRISPTKNFMPAEHTVLGWEVTQIERAAGDLMKRGVEIERYPGMEQNKLGIWTSPSGTKIAWFKDPDGNVLSLSEHPDGTKTP